MRLFVPAAIAAGIMLAAAPAFADPASAPDAAKGPDTAKGLVPEQAAPAAAATAVHIARGAHNAAGGSLPEPASWGLMIIGFGGMGAVLRSQRRALAAALSRDPQP
ncbi:PEPxxWA-CTERM sorting domain-containing protein [Phenylobacterium sp.]|uniref:PEPxxWA-CTERM sorting domain-containing protein n=1 Tax=Phenylobacterium sp. TaxID=1871053 RepID=UPI003566CFB1